MGFFKKILPMAGAVVGGMYGGPQGAMMGAQLGGGLAGGGSRGGGNPADAAMGYFNQNNDLIRQNAQPFIDDGKTAQGIANPIYGQMSQDPNTFLNSIMKNYNTSDGYNFRKRTLQGEMKNTAAAGGFAGTPYDQEQQANLVNGLLSEDMQTFLSQILGVQGQGLAGQENRITRGYGAATGLTNGLAGNAANQAGLAFQGQANQNANNQARRNNRDAMFANVLGAIGGGGGGMGGGMGGGGGFGGFGGILN